MIGADPSQTVAPRQEPSTPIWLQKLTGFIPPETRRQFAGVGDILEAAPETIASLIPPETRQQFSNLSDFLGRNAPAIAQTFTPGADASRQFVNNFGLAGNAFQQGDWRGGFGHTGLALQNATQAGLELASLGFGTAASGPLREGMAIAAQRLHLPPPTSWPEAANIAGWENSIAYKPQLHEAYMRLSRAGEPLPAIGIDPNLGPIFQSSGNYADTLHTLVNARTGVVRDALYHPQIGRIDLPWGFHGYGNNDGWGMSKLVQFHPEVVDRLDGIVPWMNINPFRTTTERWELFGNGYIGAVNANYRGQPRNWLLTAYRKD